jgi:formamidopyrimidine-DNA glycosylase
MNQSLVGGIGNYIKAEVLYRSGISPHRKVSSLNDSEFQSLNKQCKLVVESSFGMGGSSFKNYQGLEGESGQFPFFFQVYGRKECERGYSVKTEITADGRMTHWVPEIQI